MSKFIRTAVEVIGVAVAIAAAIPSGGTSLLAVGLGVSAATATAIAIGTEIAVAGITALTTKKPATLANPMEWQSDPQAPIPHVMGRMYYAGKIVLRETSGDDNKAESIHSIFSNGPIQGYESLYVSGVATTVDSAGNANINDRGKLVVTTQLGRQPEASAFGFWNSTPGLDATSKLSGLAAGAVRLYYDTKGSNTLTTEPQCGYVILGTPVYDPRKDSTYPGGSGPQRYNDETTWSFAGYNNPGLKALTYLIGYRQNGLLVIGCGFPFSSINVAQLVEMANICDANGWTLGGVIFSTDKKYGVYTQILQAGGAIPLRTGTITGCMVNTPRVSLATFERDDIIGDWSIQSTQSRRDRINAIVPGYMAERSLVNETTDASGSVVSQTVVSWGIANAGAVIVSDYVAFDGGLRQREVQYPFVTGVSTGFNAPNQIAQLARYDIENAREYGPISLSMKPRWMGFKAGDVITGGASTTEQGLVGQDIMLLQRQFNPGNYTVSFTARSETAAKHAFALGQTTIAPPTPSLSGPPLLPTPGNAAWAIVATSISANDMVVPALVVTGAIDSDVVDSIIFEYRVDTGTQGDDDDWQAAGTEAPSTTSEVITKVVGGIPYQVSVRYRQGPGSGARLILGPSTPELPVGISGYSNAQIFIYQRATSAPELPSAETTFTFATATLAGLNNGWSRTIPTGTDPIWVSVASASSKYATDTIEPNEWTAAQILALNGISTATVYLYQRTPTAPAVPSADVTFTFATGGATGLTNGWTRTIPSGSDPIWVTTGTAASSGSTDVIPTAEWATPQVLAQNGADGAPGRNNAQITLYQRATSAPAVPDHDVTVTFASGAVTGLDNGWYASQPAGTAPVWVTSAVASSTGASDIIGTAEWAAPIELLSSGIDGAPGFSTAPIFVYQRSASAPPAPDATVTYTFSTKAISGLDNGWLSYIPAGSNPIWVTTAVALSTSDTDTIAASEWATPQVLAQNGQDGAPGRNNAQVTLYQRATSAPLVPDGTVTFTFATGATSGVDNGWTSTIPGGTNPVWVTSAVASATTTTDTIASGEWATPIELLRDGGPGDPGYSTAPVFIYQRSASAPTLPGTDATYTFSAKSISGLNNGWLDHIPSGTAPIWVSTAVALSTSDTDVIHSSEWAAAQILAQNGVDGAPGRNNARVSLYQRATSAPAVPDEDVTYTFATGGMTGLDNGWSATQPAGTNPVWVTSAVASSTTATDVISSSEWATPIELLSNGIDGGPGYSSAPLFIYQRAASVPPLPDATATYTFSTKSISGLDNGWLTTIPSGSNPCYVSTATALSTGDTDTISASEWAAATILVENGAPGDPGDPGAPGLNALSVTAVPDSFTIACDFGGNPKTGELPKTSQLAVVVGTTDHTSGATYAVADTSNCSATVSSGGLVSITSPTATSGYVDITVSLTGSANVMKRIGFGEALDGAPGSSATIAGGSSSSGSWTDTGSQAKLAVGANGTIKASYRMHTGVNSNSGTWGARIQYSTDNGSTWTTLASDEDTWTASEPTSLFCSGSISGPSDLEVYLFKLQTYRTATPSATIVLGTVALQWQP